MKTEQINENEIEIEPGITEEASPAPPKQIIVIFQLVVCIIIALILFTIRSFGGSLYETVREYYFVYMNNSLITEFGSDNDTQSMAVHEDQFS